MEAGVMTMQRECAGGQSVKEMGVAGGGIKLPVGGWGLSTKYRRRVPYDVGCGSRLFATQTVRWRDEPL